MTTTLTAEKTVGDAAHGTPSWPTVLTLAASMAGILAALATVIELPLPLATRGDPETLEWFAGPRERALLLATVAALSTSVLIAAWSDVDRRRAGASRGTVAAALLAAGWAALPVSMWSSQMPARGVAYVVAALIPLALAHLAHSAIIGPGTWGRTRRTTGVGYRAAWTTAYLLVASVAAVHVLTHDPFFEERCIVNCERVVPPLGLAGLAPATDLALRGLASILGALTVALGAVTLVRAAATAIRLSGLAALTAGCAEVAWAVTPTAAAVVGPLPFEWPDLLVMRLLTHAALAVAISILLLVHARRRIRLRGIAREIVAVTPPNTVREVLALRLDDPCARIEYAVEEARLWVDEDGAVIGDSGAPGQQTAVVSREGRPVARVRFAGTAHAADLEDALGPAAVLALEAERTRAELLMRLSALQDLRRRVVEESDAARRRAERDLHDGAQHLLLAATFAIQEGLQDARTTGDAWAAERLGHALADVAGIAADLRAVAHGMYPVLLGDAGLVPALEGLARSSAARISIDADPVGRLDPSVELTVYQACAVAVRGAEQDELSISLRRRDGGLRLRVAGPRLPLQTLEPLRDRIAALGGTIETPVGSVVVEVPCA